MEYTAVSAGAEVVGGEITGSSKGTPWHAAVSKALTNLPTWLY